MRLVAEGPERLDRFLARQLPGHSRSRLQQIISEGRVLVEGQAASKSGLELRPGWVVELDDPGERPPHDLTPVEIALEVPYEDDCLLVVNKPRGLATHPAPSMKAPTLVHALLARSHGLSTGSAPYRPGIVHRLDKATTGLLMVAKTDAAHASLSRQIEDKTVRRTYVALVAGEAFHEEWAVEAPLGRHASNPTLMAVRRGGKPASTRFRVLARQSETTLLAARLLTGRTHQIRVHLASCHLPVVGDVQYGWKGPTGTPLQLHAALLSFDHPETGVRLTVYADPPGDFIERKAVVREELEEWT